MIPQISLPLCTGCGACVEACPGEVFILENEKSRVALPEECIECGACVEACPAGAVSLVDPA